MADYSIFKESRTAEELYSAYLVFREAISPEYTNRGDGDFGNVLAQGVFGAVDYLQLRQDVETIQSITDRVVRRESARAILQAYGTDLQPKTAALATVLVSITGTSLPMNDIPIDQYHTFYAPGAGKKFVVPEVGMSWRAGNRTRSLPVVQGEPRTEALGSSTGRPNQVFYIQMTDVLHYPGLETATVRVNGVPWDVVYGFAQSGPSDPHVMFQYVGSGRSRLVFGNNRMGLIPAEGSTISIDCLTGGGEDGRVGVGSITEMLSQISENGNEFPVSCTNVEAASGGTAEQSIRDAMMVNTAWWRAQDRCGPRPDVTALARKVPGVLDANAVRTGITTVTTYILGSASNGYANDALLSEVQAYLRERAMLTDDHIAQRPRLVQVDASVLVRLRKKAKWHIVQPAVEKAITDFFDLQVRKANGEALFGVKDSSDGHRYTSDLIGVLEKTEGVDSVDLLIFKRVPSIVYEQWSGNAGFGTVTVSNDTVDEEFEVLFLTPTTYTVSGSISGEVGVGTLGSVFTDADGMVSFQITAGTVAMRAGDRAQFRVSNFAGNVKLQPNEVAVQGAISVTRGT